MKSSKSEADIEAGHAILYGGETAIDGPGVGTHKPFEKYSREIEYAVNNKEVLVAVVDFDMATETITVEAAANSQSAQKFGANMDTGAIELFRIDWLIHLVHNSVSNRVITKVEYMFLTKF